MEHIAENYARGLCEIILKEEERKNFKISINNNDDAESNECDVSNDEYSKTGSEQTISERFATLSKLSQNIQPTYRTDHEEYQYLDLLKDILDNGTCEEGRNGRTKSVFGRSMRFSLKDGTIPILTTKKTAWKTCLKELLWFIRGETDNKLLKSQGVHIWDGNSSREFLDSCGLKLMTEDLIGPNYGYQWRYFNATYNCMTGKRILDNDKPGDHNIFANSVHLKGVDQLQQIIDALKDPNQRTSRRLVMSAWNPVQLAEMSLNPCHVLCQFNVHDGNKLSCSMYQRSVDCLLGACFNIASYSFMTHLLAKHCGLEAHEFVYFMGNCHIYEDHVEGAKLQLTREPIEFPTVSIKSIRENINDYQVSDFELDNYKSHDTIKFQMVA